VNLVSATANPFWKILNENKKQDSEGGLPFAFATLSELGISGVNPLRIACPVLTYEGKQINLEGFRAHLNFKGRSLAQSNFTEAHSSLM